MAIHSPVTTRDVGTAVVETLEGDVVTVGRLTLTSDRSGVINFTSRGTRGPEPGFYKLRVKRRVREAELRELRRTDRERMTVRLEQPWSHR